MCGPGGVGPPGPPPCRHHAADRLATPFGIVRARVLLDPEASTRGDSCGPQGVCWFRLPSSSSQPRSSRSRRSRRVGASTARPAATCQLSANGNIKHLVYIQFDNTHFSRDRPNVPRISSRCRTCSTSSRERHAVHQRPHDPDLAHRGRDPLLADRSLPDRNGQTVTNSYGYFTHWRRRRVHVVVQVLDEPGRRHRRPGPNMITDAGKTTPAPWVPFTRAGCDFGGVGTANIELENNSTAPGGDIDQRLRAGSPEEAAEPRQPSASRPTSSGSRSTAPRRRRASAPATRTPERPAARRAGRLHGLPGAVRGEVRRPGGHRRQPVRERHPGAAGQGPAGNCGFPGFDGMLAKNSLGYVAQMQETGVPVTYAYISDAHDNHTLARRRPAPARPTTSSSSPTTTRRSRPSSSGSRPTGSTRATRCSSSPSTRATTTPAAPARRRGNLRRAHACTVAPVRHVPGEPDRRGEREPIGTSLPAAGRCSTSTSTTAPTFYVNGDAAHRTIRRDDRRCGSWNATSGTRPPRIRTRARRPSADR